MGKTDISENTKYIGQQNSIAAVWPGLLNLIKANINESSFDRWFGNIISVTRHNDVVSVTVPDVIACEYMESQFSQMIRSNLQQLTGESVRIAFLPVEGDSRPYNTSKPPSFEKTSTYEDPPDNADKTDAKAAFTGFTFNSRYTFNSFVVGNSNRFAHAAAMAVAEKPARTYNPLFIYGGSGLGKTHLMHAIGQTVLRKNPSMKVVYVSTESFTNDFISMVRTGKAYNFKNRYRTADIFLVDDIQFLTGKEGIQEEFFHTFNALHEAGKQIVISSDRPPKEILTLEDRLRSRFEWGLITDIQSPDIETRIAILQRKAQNEQANISNDVLFMIADKIKSNIRELEGALNKVIYFAELNNIREIEISDALEALRGILPEDKKPPLTIDYIQKTISGFFDLSLTELKSKKRSRSIVYPRQIGMYLCRELTDYPFDHIGGEFGGRDHSTVMHAHEKITTELKDNLQLEKNIAKLKELLENR